MNNRLRFIKHHGHDILLVDFSHGSKQELLALLDQVKATVTHQPQNSVLTLADFTGAQVDKEIGMRIKEVLVFDRPYVKRAAWVGTEGLPKVFYENFKAFSRRDFPTFENREEAMEWLVGED